MAGAKLIVQTTWRKLGTQSFLHQRTVFLEAFTMRMPLVSPVRQ